MNKEALLAFAPLIARAILQVASGNLAANSEIEGKLTAVLIFFATLVWSHYEKKKLKSTASPPA